MLRTWIIDGALALALSAALVALTSQSLAAVMSSSSYKIQSDSVNIGGGSGSSASYNLESTVGEVGTGISTSTNYSLSAGYQAMGGTYLSLTAPGNVTMSPSLGGITGGTSNGSTTLSVLTDDPAGYQVTMASSQSPALSSGAAAIADYAPAGGVPDYAFSTAQAGFGYTAEGTDISTRFKDNGSSCNTGTNDTADACWDGLSPSGTVIASRTTDNQPSGTATTLKFRVYLPAGVQASGQYVATTTITAVPL